MKTQRKLEKLGRKKNAAELFKRIEDLRKKGATARANALIKRYNRRYL